jgi:deoxycytidylate deaminase
VAINISYYDAMDTSLHARIQLRNAYLAAKRSDDRSTKNGVILTTQDMEVVGFNHFTPGFGDKEEHHERPLKYSLVEHAEADAIHAAASLGVNTNGAIMFAPWAPCPDCARAIVGAGAVAGHGPPRPGHPQARQRPSDSLRWRDRRRREP